MALSTEQLQIYFTENKNNIVPYTIIITGFNGESLVNTQPGTISLSDFISLITKVQNGLIT